ncbi:MAG: glycosyltransferase family 4 protein [Mariniblastus sp.]|nr:glycosyltransferase family 4 protein [Mariniblastus sp.]
MVQASPYFFYVCSGRNFKKSDPGRKIFEVVRCWRELGFQIEHTCGADISTNRRKTEHGLPTTNIQNRPGRSRIQSFSPAIFHSISEFRDIRHDRKMLSHLRSLSQKRKPEFIWERSCRLHWAGLKHAKELGVPYILEWKDHLVDYQASWYRNRALALELKKNNKADRIVVESNVLKDNLINQGINGAKIIVAHNAIDSSIFRPNQDHRKLKRAELGIDNDTILAGYLGSYAFYHNTELLIQAANLVENPKVKFVLIGDGLELEQCRTLAKKLGVLEKNLVMLPRTTMDQVPLILCALDIAILPGSTDIICPIKIQEYMASGTATVAPDYSCNREVVPNENVGSLFQPGNANALANAIDELANNPSRRNAIGAAARNHVLQEFTWEKTWGRAIELVHKAFH